MTPQEATAEAKPRSRGALPVLPTARLYLRPFALSDAPSVQALAGAFEVADTTLLIPHPYADGAAERWIATHSRQWERNEAAIFAIVHRQENSLCGAIGLQLHLPHGAAEMGYWIGVPFWRRGYCTEAAREVLAFGFRQLNLNRIFAHHFVRNPASGRVLEKIGMRREGCLRQHVRKWERFEDLACYGILREDWAAIVPAA